MCFLEIELQSAITIGYSFRHEFLLQVLVNPESQAVFQGSVVNKAGPSL